VSLAEIALRRNDRIFGVDRSESCVTHFAGMGASANFIVTDVDDQDSVRNSLKQTPGAFEALPTA